MATDPIWIIPRQALLLADGSTLVKPGKAVQRATVAQTVKITGVSRKTLAALADCGLIRRQRPSPNQSFYFPAEVEELLARTETEPGFWDSVKTRAFLQGINLKSANPK
jgi:hypothetical protein